MRAPCKRILRVASIEIGLVVVAAIAQRWAANGVLVAEIVASTAGATAAIIAAFEIGGVAQLSVRKEGTEAGGGAKERRRFRRE